MNIPLKKNMRVSLIACLIVFCLGVFACARAPYTGRSQLMIMDVDEEKALGAAYSKEILKKSAVVTGTSQSRMVDRVGKRIAAAAEQPDPEVPEPIEFKWEFHTVKDNEVNAFCLPGGSVFVNTGILNVVKSDDELAAIIGHEVAHALVRHGAERMSQESLSSLFQSVGALAVGVATQSDGASELFSSAYGAGMQYGVLLPFSRTHESEADYIGLILATKAGYDPAAAVTFWQRMASMNKNAEIAEWQSTHPSDETRIAELKKLLPEMEKYRPKKK